MFFETRTRRSSRKFVPSGLEKGSPTWLEPRALTAPAVWRRPPEDPLRAGDNVGAGVVDSQSSPDVSGSSDSFIALANDSKVTDPNTLATMTMSGSVTNAIFEVDDPAAPAPPVGNAGITIDTTNDIQFDSDGDTTGVFNSLGTQTSGVRNYLLADDGTVPPTQTATITEHYTVHYDRPMSFPTIMMVNASVTTPGMSVSVLGNQGAGLTEVQINGTDIQTQGSGTVAGPLGTITYSFSATDVSVTAVSTVGPLPLATPRNPDGTIPGMDWKVTYAAGMGGQSGGINGTGTDQESLTTHYDNSIQ